MKIKFATYLKIWNFVFSLLLVFYGSSVYCAEIVDDILGDVDTLPLRFTPRCEPIAQEEFNAAARALYSDCVNNTSIEGKKALEAFKRTYTDLSSLPKDFREYIENIHSVQTVIYAFIENLNILKAKGGIERLMPLIAGRESLILAVAHCAFDFNNYDLYWFTKLGMKFGHKIYGTSVVTEATVDRNGIIHKVNGKPTISAEKECENHPDFGRLCEITKSFIDALLAIEPVINRLSATDRLSRVAVAEASKKEERK